MSLRLSCIRGKMLMGPKQEEEEAHRYVLQKGQEFCSYLKVNIAPLLLSPGRNLGRVLVAVQPLVRNKLEGYFFWYNVTCYGISLSRSSRI
jgi:hypothetical protein